MCCRTKTHTDAKTWKQLIECLNDPVPGHLCIDINLWWTSVFKHFKLDQNFLTEMWFTFKCDTQHRHANKQNQK